MSLSKLKLPVLEHHELPKLEELLSHTHLVTAQNQLLLKSYPPPEEDKKHTVAIVCNKGYKFSGVNPCLGNCPQGQFVCWAHLTDERFQGKSEEELLEIVLEYLPENPEQYIVPN